MKIIKKVDIDYVSKRKLLQTECENLLGCSFVLNIYLNFILCLVIFFLYREKIEPYILQEDDFYIVVIFLLALILAILSQAIVVHPLIFIFFNRVCGHSKDSLYQFLRHIPKKYMFYFLPKQLLLNDVHANRLGVFLEKQYLWRILKFRQSLVKNKSKKYDTLIKSLTNAPFIYIDETAAGPKANIINWLPPFDENEFFADDSFDKRLESKQQKWNTAEERFNIKISEALQFICEPVIKKETAKIPEIEKAEKIREIYNIAVQVWNFHFMNYRTMTGNLYFELVYESYENRIELRREKNELFRNLFNYRWFFSPKVDALILKVEYNYSASGDGGLRVYSYFDENKASSINSLFSG